jgi:hypothetical protein
MMRQSPSVAIGDIYRPRSEFMIELAFIACLASGSEACHERQIIHLPDIGLTGCMTTAQAHLAQWSETHPGYEIQRWTCGYRRPDARDA